MGSDLEKKLQEREDAYLEILGGLFVESLKGEEANYTELRAMLGELRESILQEMKEGEDAKQTAESLTVTGVVILLFAVFSFVVKKIKESIEKKRRENGPARTVDGDVETY